MRPLAYARVLLASCTLATGASGLHAAEQAEKPCTIAGMNLAADPDFVAAATPPGETSGSFMARACKKVSDTDREIDGARLRLVLSDFYSDAEATIKMNVQMVEIQRVEAAGPRSLGRIVLPPDALDNQTRFEPQVVKKDGTILVRLSPRHRGVYTVSETGIAGVPAFAWRSDLQVDPALRDAGQNLAIDLERMEGRIALVRADGARPLSAFESADIAVARLTFADGKLKIVSSEVTKRKQGDDAIVDEAAALEDERRSDTPNLPKGVEPCSLTAWSIDKDPVGLNVRAEPSVTAKILGIVPPPRVAPKKYEAVGPEPVKAEFSVIGYRDGWFLIEKIEAPGVAYDIPYPASLPKPFKGRGWVAGNKIGAAPAFTGLPFGRIYTAPHVEARYEMRTGGTDNPFARVLACSGSWGHVEAEGGKRGWVRGLCSNQVTTCS